MRVRLEATGLCHTDWDELRRSTGPLVLGHEGADVPHEYAEHPGGHDWAY